MKQRNLFLIVGLTALWLMPVTGVFAQDTRHDQGSMVEHKNTFWDKIKSESEAFREKEKPERKDFKMDPSGFVIPALKDFKQVWHFEPVSQGWTGTCWTFSTTSYLESECYRQTGKKIKISEIYTAYCEYIEKARGYVETRGESLFAEGSEGNAVTRIWDQYGCVPSSVYTGLLKDQPFHDHSVLYDEMYSYLQSVKASNAWNEDAVLSTIKAILNTHLGTPPSEFEYEGKTYTPKTFLSDVVKLKTEDFVEFISLKEIPYYTKGVYDVPDNWWHSDDYYNVPLADFMDILHGAIDSGYSICLGGDVSESGYLPYKDIATIPTYDIPSEYIDENAREFRFSNKTTTDDHGIHLVGTTHNESGNWYLIKDSGSGSRNGVAKGYYFYHEDYIKLKMMNIMIHKSAVKGILEKFKKD